MEKKLKILHTNTGMVAGGAERLIADMLPLLKAGGQHVELLLLEDKGDNIFEDRIIESAIKINKLPYNNKFDLRNIFHIRKKMKNFDVVHVHLFPLLYLVPLAAIGMKKRPLLIVTEHNTHNRRRDLKIFKGIEKFIYSKYDKVISISPESELNLLNWLKESKTTKYEVVLNGINLKLFKEAAPLNRSELVGIELERGNKLLLMTARFDSQKDHETLFKALKIVPDYIKLLLVGEGKLEEKCKSQIKNFGLENRVFFLGSRNNVPNILKSVDISILSSHWEGFGLVIVEAMAAGIPVIASSVPGVENIVKNFGLLFKKGDYKELAKHIITLINHEEVYKTNLIKGRIRAEDFNIEKMVDKYVSIYKEQNNIKRIN